MTVIGDLHPQHFALAVSDRIAVIRLCAGLADSDLDSFTEILKRRGKP